MVLSYWKWYDCIHVLSDESNLYCLQIKDVFKWLIDKGHLILEFDTEEGLKRVNITYDEWFNDNQLCKMDLKIYLNELKKQNLI